MVDSFGRTIDYVRISVTDRCNLRCTYCMPEYGIESVSHFDILRYDEIIRIVKILAYHGFKKIKITGGEPLVRKDLHQLVAQLNQINGIEQITLTTNGVLLAESIDELVKAGISAINISLDTLNKELYHRMTRRDQLENALLGIKSALNYPQLIVKINCVPLGIKEQNLVEIASLAQNLNISVRFIEMMPIGYGNEFEFVSQKSIEQLIEKEYGPLIPVYEKLGNGPSKYYKIDGFKGIIGFISSLSHKYCDCCNRVRLTCEGFLKTCLQYNNGYDLRSLIRNGGTDEQISRAIIDTVDQKPLEHNFDKLNVKEKEIKSMFQIGG